MKTVAVLLQEPERLGLAELDLSPAGDADVVVDVEFSGISTGTERLLWSGQMPPFPGMGYPLVPGYESVGRVASAGPGSGRQAGERVFVPGAQCFGEIRGLFGGSASRLVVPGSRATPLPDNLGRDAVLIALAATAHHALAGVGAPLPDLIVGHGVLGRLLARIALTLGSQSPVVWEKNPARANGERGYAVIDPAADSRRDYRSIYDVSGDAGLLDTLIQSLGRGGHIVLAGFYSERLSFAFPPAFMREARLTVAAEWQPRDLDAVIAMIADGRLSLDGLVTHSVEARDAANAYRTAFTDPACLKMVLDWSSCA